MTAKGENVELESAELRSAYVGVFRYDTVVGLALLGSFTEPLDDGHAKATIAEAMRVTAGYEP